MISGLPASCRVQIPIFKKDFTRHVALSRTEKQLLQRAVRKMTLVANLKEGTIGIRPYEDKERSYKEIQILQVLIEQVEKARAVADLIVRSIPYPLLIIIESAGKEALAASPPRINQSDPSKFVHENLCCTDFEEGLSQYLDLQKWQHTNFYDLYIDLYAEVVRIYAAQKGIVHDGADLSALKEQIAQLDEFEKQITTLRRMLKREDQFHKQVDLSMRIRCLKAEAQQLKQGKSDVHGKSGETFI